MMLRPSLVLLMLAGFTSARADAPIEQLIGGIDALIVACGPVDAKTAKAGNELLQQTTAQRKLDLATIRKSDGYKAIYNSEVNRMLSLPTKERITACQTAF